MKKNRIGLYQTGILAFFFSRSFFIIGLVPLLFKISGIDSLISILFGTIIGLIILFLYLKVMKKMNNKDLMDTIKQTFPKPFDYIFIIILILGIILFGSFLLSKISLYINYMYLENSSLFIISISFFLICYFMAKGGLETIARSAEIIFVIFIILFILGLIGVIPLIEPTRLKPFFSNNWSKISISSFIYALTISIPLFLITMIPLSKIRSNQKISKVIIISYLFASATIFLTFISIIGTLGIDLASFYQYPELAILKKISYFKFIERVEGILSLTFLLDGLITLALLILSFNKGITLLCNGKIKTFFQIITLFIFIVLSSRINLSLKKLLLPLGLIFIFIPIFVLLQLTFSKIKKKNG